MDEISDVTKGGGGGGGVVPLDFWKSLTVRQNFDGLLTFSSEF